MLNILETINNFRELKNFLLGFLLELGKNAPSSSPELFLVGGVVRDFFAMSLYSDIDVERSGNLFHDLDFMVTNISYSQLGKLLKTLELRNLGIKKIVGAGKHFPVYKVCTVWAEEPLDVALARTEESFGYGHRDFVLKTSSVSPKDDASRRDFTMNSLFFKLAVSSSVKPQIQGEVVDYFGGIESIKKKEIKAILSPHKRFSEDPLRMLRAIRQRVQRPGYYIEEKTEKAIKELLPKLLSTISVERIVDEFLKALSASPSQAILAFCSFGVFREILPELDNLSFAERENLCRRTELTLNAKESDNALILSSVILEPCLKKIKPTSKKLESSFYDVGAAARKITSRLHLPSKRILFIINSVMKMINIDKILFPNVTIENISSLDMDTCIIFYEAHQKVYNSPIVNFRKIANKIWKVPRFVSGKELANIGIKPGPCMKTLLCNIREKELLGDIRNTQEGLLYAKKTYKELSAVVE